jgi:molybdopterin/thiamine biosynthesis adenylyltransferase
MPITVTMRDTQLSALGAALFGSAPAEGAAYLLCGRSQADDELRLLVQDIVPVRDEHYLVREPDRLSIDSASYVAIAKRAAAGGLSVLFAHSHPGGYRAFSPQDDRQEPRLLDFLAARAPGVPHGALLLPSPTDMLGGVVLPGGARAPIARIRVIGERFRFLDGESSAAAIPPFFDRQVRAFGPDIQRLLGRLHIGVVGAGGTGSGVIEQLARLGVGKLSLFDGDQLSGSNATRVHGSGAGDAGQLKVDVAAAMVARIGFGTSIRRFPKHVTHEAVARELRACDIVFCCTDKQAPRGIVCRLAVRYYIPVIDRAVVVDSVDGTLRGVDGRVTTLLPGEACLFCRGRISPERIQAEALPPELRRRLAAEGYAPELDTEDPAVVAFTTAVASQAVIELLHRLTGFMGPERVSTEVLLRLHESRMRTNRQPAAVNCLCAERRHWGRGDQTAFLDLSWPEPAEN